MSEIPIEKVIELRKRLKKFIKKAKKLPHGTMFDMDKYKSCAFAIISESPSLPENVAAHFSIPKLRTLDRSEFWIGLSPAQEYVVSLFTTINGEYLSVEEWIKQATKVSKFLKKQILTKVESQYETNIKTSKTP